LKLLKRGQEKDREEIPVYVGIKNITKKYLVKKNKRIEVFFMLIY